MKETPLQQPQSPSPGINVLGKRNFGLSVNDDTYRQLLKEVDDSKGEYESKLEKIRKFLESLEKRHFEANLEILKRLFIHDVSCLKSVEYDLNNIINVGSAGVQRGEGGTDGVGAGAGGHQGGLTRSRTTSFSRP